jgi:hypothetical protein
MGVALSAGQYTAALPQSDGAVDPAAHTDPAGHPVHTTTDVASES